MSLITYKGYEIELYADRYTLINIFPEKNLCCPGKPFVLTSNECPKSDERPLGINFSCQCACGAWCTSGFAEPGDAVEEYRKMVRLRELEIMRDEQGIPIDYEQIYDDLPSFSQRLYKSGYYF